MNYVNSRSENTKSQTVRHFSQTFSCPCPQERTGQIMLKRNNTRIFMHVQKTEWHKQQMLTWEKGRQLGWTWKKKVLVGRFTPYDKDIHKNRTQWWAHCNTVCLSVHGIVVGWSESRIPDEAWPHKYYKFVDDAFSHFADGEGCDFLCWFWTLVIPHFNSRVSRKLTVAYFVRLFVNSLKINVRQIASQCIYGKKKWRSPQLWLKVSSHTSMNDDPQRQSRRTFRSETARRQLTRWVPHDGYIRHQNDHLSGRMTDISVMGEWQVAGVGGTRPIWNVLGEAIEGRFSFEAQNYLFSFQSYVRFEEFFCFPPFSKIWRQMFKLWGFWFGRCFWALFENSAPSPGIFANSDYDHKYFLKIFLSFFPKQSRFYLPDSYGDPNSEQSTLVMVRRKLE